MAKSPLSIQQHLYQLYPNIPQFANDPEECQIIRSYDLMSKRFQGIYGNQPKLFIRSPATCAILGSASHVVQSPVASFNCLHNVVICVSQNGHQKLRINHYQTAVYGQKVFDVDSVKWKHDQNNDEYASLLVASLKAYSSLFNIHTLPGLDILIFDDFIQDNYLNWKEALCLGVAVAVHTISQPPNCLQALNFEFSKKYLNKINSLTHLVKPIDYPFTSLYGSIHVNEPEKEFDIEVPKDLEFIIANSMTPMPKKMIKGKRQNLRAAEILIGIEIIKTEIGAASNISSLSSYLNNIGELKKYLSCTTAQLIETVEEYLPKEGLNADKIEQLIQKSLIDTLKELPFANNVIDQNIIFKPYKRIKFYLEEELSLQSLTPQNLVEKINQSHSNGIDLLEIGSEQISDMIEIFKDLAKGWKIIGDGWGGNLLIVCQSGMSKHILEELTKNFYMSPKNQVLLSDDIEQYIKIVGKPGNGIGILDPSSQIWF